MIGYILVALICFLSGILVGAWAAVTFRNDMRASE